MLANCSIILIDVKSIQNDVDGERVKEIVSLKKIIGEKNDVGMNTFFNATANNIQLEMSIRVRSRAYKKQKYVFIDNELYEVFNTGKGTSLNEKVLNIRRSKDVKLKESIINALG